ncbi:hypothetical protein SAMN05421820_102358 [Pedobacter steynii]|uniref:Uncharacterized protein n=1 Tax=Pedobacter steynii TaxID=430522 RepID=A0A1G9NLS9_9SPHI|nr:hypothetical protein [Pedobacter steynii]NQX39270.1 hypothetical protein [Pedobacter steynii]SDL86977.1 hypothetical protein SAMN05421820_102358 [Pedobacter steynii]
MNNIDKAGQENRTFNNSAVSTIDWWKGLNHNWKKNLLANLDFSSLFGKDYCIIFNVIRGPGIYSAYCAAFNERIRKRLDEFIVTEEIVDEILNLKCLVLGSSGLKDAYPLNRFLNLRVLCITDYFNVELFVQAPKMERLKVLYIGYYVHKFKGISNWSSLEHVCYYLSFQSIGEEELSLCKNFKLIHNGESPDPYIPLDPVFFNVD